jgi:hypothetical protein
MTRAWACPLACLLGLLAALGCNTGPRGSIGPAGPQGNPGPPGLDFNGEVTFADGGSFELDRGVLVIEGPPGPPATSAVINNGGTAAVDGGQLAITLPPLLVVQSTAVAGGGGHVFLKGGDNGTVSCDTFCSDLAGSWGASGTCVGARIALGAGSGVTASYNGKYLPCASSGGSVTGWTAAVDQIQCWCVNFP